MGIPRKIALCLCIPLLVTIISAVPTTAGQKNGGLEIKNTVDFFWWYHDMKSRIENRDEFESSAEHKKKMPPPFNSQKTIYFIMEPEFPRNYSYDADTQTMTVSSGQAICEAESIEGDVKYRPKKWDALFEGIAFKIKEERDTIGTYIGQNAFGAEAVVKRVDCSEYILNLLNVDHLPAGVYDTDSRRLTLSFQIPAKEAERVSHNLQIVLGVTLPGYAESLFECTGAADPKIDRPVEMSFFEHVITANLVKVIVRHATTGKIYRVRGVL